MLWFISNDISFDQDPTYSFTRDGIYEVCLAAENISRIALLCIKLNITKVLSLDINQATNIFTIWSNPSNGLINIQLPKLSREGQQFISIMDLQGRLVYQNLTIPAEGTINLELKSGIYFLKLKNNSGLSSYIKLMVNHFK